MIIENDKDISELLCMHFQKFGFFVYKCTDFSKITDEFEAINPHLVLLDINLPSYDGFYYGPADRGNYLRRYLRFVRVVCPPERAFGDYRENWRAVGRFRLRWQVGLARLWP